MPSYPIPPWLQRPADPASEYMGGVAQGRAIASEQARLQMEAQQQATALAESARRLQIEDARHQQQIELQKAYHDQQNQLRQQQLSTVQQHVQMQTQQAAQRYAAQQKYQQAVAAGADPRTALMQLGPQMGMTGAGMASLTRPSAAWIPPDVKSGAPGHFVSSGGGVTIPPSARQGGQLTQRDILGALKAKAKELSADPDVTMQISGQADPETKKRMQAKKAEYQQVEDRIDKMISGQGQAAPQAKSGGKIFKDAKGNKWRYTGTNENPKADTDEDNWEEVK